MDLNPDFFDIDGVSFEDASPNRKRVTVEGLEIPCLSREDLIRNKAASGLDKDLVDLKTLRGHEPSKRA